MNAIRLEDTDYIGAQRKLAWQNKRLQLLVKQFQVMKQLRNFCQAKSVNIESLVVQEAPIREFFGYLLEQSGLDKLTTLAMILLAQKELAYEQYAGYIGNHMKRVEDVVKKTYYYDLKYHCIMDMRRIKRRLVELKLTFKQNFFNDYKINMLYQCAQEEARLKKCATSLLNSFKKESKDDTLAREIVEVASAYACDMSFELEDYHTHVKDCQLKSSPIEEYFKNHCREIIIKHYDGCAKCHKEDTEESRLKLVHLWKPKAECGTFAMRSKTGYYVNNCIPLCPGCNTERARQSIFLLFNQDRMVDLLNKSKAIDGVIHKNMIDFEDKYFPKCKKNKRVL